MTKNYSTFYFSMLVGLSFIFAVFLGETFGFVNLEYWLFLFFWGLGLTLAMLYQKEVLK